MTQPPLASKGFFMLILVFLLLSPAFASAVSSENRLTGYFEESKDSFGIFMTETSEIPSLVSSLFFALESSFLLTENKGETNKHIEIMSPLFFLAAGILAGFNPCLLAVMAFLATIIPAQRAGRKEMLENYFRFFNRDLNNTYICRNRYPQYSQLPARNPG